jgi:hypothetical protein
MEMSPHKQYQPEKRRTLPAGPTTAIDALKWIGLGIACLSFGAATVYIGIIPYSAVILGLIALIAIPFGMVAIQ